MLTCIKASLVETLFMEDKQLTMQARHRWLSTLLRIKLTLQITTKEKTTGEQVVTLRTKTKRSQRWEHQRTATKGGEMLTFLSLKDSVVTLLQ